MHPTSVRSLHRSVDTTRRPRSDGRRVFRAAALNLAALVLLAPPAPAAAQESEPSVASGTALLQEQRWDEAAETFRAVTEREPGNAVAWYRLGMALQEGGMQAEAMAPLERAAEMGFQTPYARARIARAHAALGHAEEAMRTLEQALDEGLDAPLLLDSPDFASLAGTERFRAIAHETRVAAEPCTHIEEYHAFDFWVGQWDVFDPAGQQVGENRIEPLMGSCALQENWTDANGRQGKSLNVYDRVTGMWRQLWVSDRGNVTDYRKGRVEDGAMRFEATVTEPGGDTVQQRMIFTPVSPDTVTQEILRSEDGGQWTPAWMGIYVRRGEGEGGGG